MEKVDWIISSNYRSDKYPINLIRFTTQRKFRTGDLGYNLLYLNKIVYGHSQRKKNRREREIRVGADIQTERVHQILDWY